MKRSSLYLDPKDMRKLEAIGKKKGGLKSAQLVRLAIAEFIEREESKAKESR
jgi:hypothetical protein